MTNIATLSEIHKIPKVELHIHLEGCISYDCICELCLARNIPIPNSLSEIYPTDNLTKFLAGLDWVCSLVEDKSHVEKIARDFANYCLRENIVYCEVIVNPTHWGGLHYAELLMYLADSFDNLCDEVGVDICVLPSLLRQQASYEAVELAHWISNSRHPRILGISVDGNEATSGLTGKKFSSAYAIIRRAGLKCTAHAGESSGAEGVQSALDDLLVHRLDHGVRVIEDESLTRRVAEERIALNVCVSSNCHLLYDSVEKHPFKELRRKGVLMTLNTDDPIVLNTTLSKEIAWVSKAFDLSLKDVFEFQRTAVHAAFCSETKKDVLLAKISESANELSSQGQSR